MAAMELVGDPCGRQNAGGVRRLPMEPGLELLLEHE
jgi:hypothetical protein